MPNVTFIQPDGSRQVIEVEIGATVMHAASKHEVQGIAGECNGRLSCATCKVKLDADWLARVPAMGELEASLIDGEDPDIRLSCQIPMTAELDGIEVHVPSSQY